MNEEDAFWCLVYIVDHLMPTNYYCKQRVGAQVDQVREAAKKVIIFNGRAIKTGGGSAIWEKDITRQTKNSDGLQALGVGGGKALIIRP